MSETILKDPPPPVSTGGGTKIEDRDKWFAASDSVLRDAEGMPVLFVNAPAMGAVLMAKQEGALPNGAMEIHGDTLSAMDIAALNERVKIMRRLFGETPLIRAQEHLAAQASEATRRPGFHGGLPVVQAGDSVAPETVAQTVKEQLDRARQMHAAGGNMSNFLPETFVDNPIALKAARHLVASDYLRSDGAGGVFDPLNRRVVAVQISAHLMRPNGHAELGLTPDETRRLGAMHNFILVQQHGDRADEVVSQVRNAMPEEPGSLKETISGQKLHR